MTSTDAERRAFKQAEMDRWYDAECAGRVAEAVAAERARAEALVEAVREHRRERSHGVTANMQWADAQLDDALDEWDRKTLS